jgi:peptide/nickel transport system substrate-binding protein
LAELWIVPEHVWADVAPADIPVDDGSTGIDPSRVVGTGPFKLVERIVEDRTTVERHEDYWGGRPQLAQVVFPFNADPATFEPLLRSGEIDTGWITFEAVPDFRTLDHIQMHEYYSHDFTGPMWNLDPERTTLFQDLKVRQALVHAIDREVLAEVGFLGLATFSRTILAPGAWSNDEANVTVEYPYDPELANQLLDEAGWVIGDDGIREKDGQRFSFTFVGTEHSTQRRVIMQEYWRAVGVEMLVEDVFDDAYSELRPAGDFDMIWTLFHVGGSGYDGLQWQFHSANYPNGGNNNMFSDPQVDELLDGIKAELDPEARIELFTQLQNRVLELLPVLPLVHDFDPRPVNKRVHNLYPNAHRTVFNAETWWVDE